MDPQAPAKIRQTLQALPRSPGVYLMRDASGEVIYVGKALRLRERVRSYFQPYHQRHDPKVLALSQSVDELEFIVTRSETEALVLEEQLIKSHRPRFNVRLKDDKSFPHLKLTLDEPFPRLQVTRRVERDGAKYFGPYTHAQLARETLNALRRYFPVRTCNDAIADRPTRARPCLDFFIRQCPAPCVQRVSAAAYRQGVKALQGFLAGQDRSLLKTLTAQMDQAASELDFERAARLRDALAALRSLVGQQRAVTKGSLTARDVVGLSLAEDLCAVQVFFVREGAIKGRERVFLETPPGSDAQEVLYAFLTQFYAEATVIPREILLPSALAEGQEVERWLSKRLGSRVKLLVPQRGPKRKLVTLATRNAELTLFEAGRQQDQPERRRQALVELQTALQLARVPQRIECYDISNLQGQQAVGAMVVFEEGLPAKAEYRRFQVRSVRGSNDFAMLAEVLRRRFAHGLEEQRRLLRPQPAAGPSGKLAVKFAHFPDLIVVDGGKGQLSAAREVLRALELEDLPLVALAKRREELFRPGRSEPLLLPRDSGALHVLQHLRDEAHRFGLAYHRSLRQRRTVHSALDEVPGVGPQRKAKLLQQFGSVQQIRAARLEELERVPGLPRSVARRVYDALHAEGDARAGG